jgi:hypothetical protein
MSTSYRSLTEIPYESLFDSRLEKHGVREELRSDTTAEYRYLVGRDGALIAFPENNGLGCSFSRPSFAPMPWAVLDALVDEFQVELVTEYDHRYLGFDAAEEWDAFQEELAKENEDWFYKNLLHYVRGEPNDLPPGTIGMTQADIAKTLIELDQSLAEPGKREVLLKKVEAVYWEKHSVSVSLTDADREAAKMFMARIKDLPKG